ncbi:pullulanase [Lysinibacillus sphaericus]|uniref:Pullulanase n=4 Tax=Lysinibacillus TaxID=400634 RepID=A0A2S0K615_LYSSH|nr:MULTISPECIES: DUF6509 family protein [Lysinibacillus]AHN20185.1 hypothetical protein T479_00810 [Lysinibacillus varians]AVK98776.1 pullulanase [Lysinibacillus sphaericus]MCS1384266.1 DUF6509 family protein [Lysinibacillus sphaericus]MED4543118.1 DUF6509 family protein [Lysinibacillus sphaericus]TKI17920.1 pullulanase [Lysinibacillus sphaericus]
MDITQFSMEEILDPTNIIEGKRFEFILDVDIDEEDELYHEAGIEIRVLIGEKEGAPFILNYFIMEKAEGEYLDFALEDDELEEILTFCKEEITKA